MLAPGVEVEAGPWPGTGSWLLIAAIKVCFGAHLSGKGKADFLQ